MKRSFHLAAQQSEDSVPVRLGFGMRRSSAQRHFDNKASNANVDADFCEKNRDELPLDAPDKSAAQTL